MLITEFDTIYKVSNKRIVLCKKAVYFLIICAFSITALCACSSSVDFKPQYASGAELNPRVQGVPAVSLMAPNAALKVKKADSDKNLSGKLSSSEPKPAVGTS